MAARPGGRGHRGPAARAPASPASERAPRRRPDGGGAPGRLTPEAVRARILYRDSLVIVLDKPAGVPVHSGPGGGLNLEMFFHGLRFGLDHPPALAHRLDRDTSGCLVLGRGPRALARLGRLFRGGMVEKVYWAVVAGTPPGEAGRVDLPLRKLTSPAGWRMVVDERKGQKASTDWRLLGLGRDATGAPIAWLELRPLTGRTHQIRVHCAALGCPVLGDPHYGAPRQAASGVPMHLHARRIVLPLYPRHPPLDVTAPPPAHMLAALAACGWSERQQPTHPPGVPEAPEAAGD